MDAIVIHVLISFGLAIITFLILEFVLRLRPNNYRWWIIIALVIGTFILGIELPNI